MSVCYGSPIQEIDSNGLELPEHIYGAREPIVIRGLVADWPIVKHAAKSNQAAVDYLLSFYNKRAVNAFMAKPEAKGRIFYNEQLDGFNFVQSNVYLSDVLAKIIENINLAEQATFYVGSLEIEQHLPGFTHENALNLQADKIRKSIWLGNHSVIAPHFDFPAIE